MAQYYWLLTKLFKISLWFLALFLCFVTPSYAGDVTLVWDSNTEPDLAGYGVYYKIGSSGEPYNGTDADAGNSPIDVGNVTQYTLTGLRDGEVHYVVVTAYDTEGLESDYSNEVNTSELVISPLEEKLADKDSEHGGCFVPSTTPISGKK